MKECHPQLDWGSINATEIPVYTGMTRGLYFYEK